MQVCTDCISVILVLRLYGLKFQPGSSEAAEAFTQLTALANGGADRSWGTSITIVTKVSDFWSEM